MITEDYIKNAYHQVLKEVSEVLPVSKWQLAPAGIGFTTEKTKYGLATPEGMVLINRFFIGTTAYTKLDFTLRHELAHAAAGLHNHHNRRFRMMERAFGVDPDRELSDEIAQIQRRIDFKYTVFAHLENGRVHNLGGVHRKTKTYTEYPKDGRYTMSIEGVRVVRFEFQVNAA